MPETVVATAGQDGAGATDPKGLLAPVAPALDPAQKAANDQRAREGRERAELKRQLDESQANLANLKTQLDEVVTWRNERDQAEHDAYLASLPENERLKVELQDIRDQNARLERKVDERKAEPAAPAAQPTQRRLTPDEITALKQQHADRANAEFGLTGDFRIDPDSPELDATTQAGYVGGLKTLGSILKEAQARAGGQPITQETQVAKPSGESKVELTEAELNERINRAVSERLGVGAPLSPEAAAGSRGTGTGPTSEDMKDTTRGYSSKLGPRAQLQKLQAQRAGAEKALVGTGG